MNTTDTIAAPCSSAAGAVTVIRISGRDALAVGNRVWRGRMPLSAEIRRELRYGFVGEEPVLAVYMPGPHSYTAEDVVEIHCHGGAAASANALRRIFAAGARPAEPGEFTFRAFVNGRIDLVQAEAVADLIGSASDGAMKLAARQLAGSLSARLNALTDALDRLRSECEARLDFPDEELELSEETPKEFDFVRREIAALLATREAGARLRNGVEVVLAGRPNAGKSSLFNRLLGSDRAIVSPYPGTTRDTVEAELVLRSIPVHLVDTAGLRESGDPVEMLGVERSRRSVAAAAVTLFLLDASGDADDEAAFFRANAPRRVIIVWNKIDLVPERELPDCGVPAVRVSAETGQGIEALAGAFAELVAGSAEPLEPEIAVNERCAAGLEQAQPLVESALRNYTGGAFEIASAELAAASSAVGVIVGRSVAPDVLDAVFHRFCIGK